MKKYILILFFLLSLISCHDEEDMQDSSEISLPIGTIIADIDGVETVFDVDAKAFVELIDWDFQQTALKISIKGDNGNLADSKNILIWFFVVPVKQIDAGIYPDLDKQIYHFLEFNNNFRGEILNWGSNRSVEGYNSISTITRIDSLIQGRFKGVVSIGAGPSTDGPEPPLTYDIENGLFNVSLSDWNINRTANIAYGKKGVNAYQNRLGRVFGHRQILWIRHLK